jgi:hypothetical protein
MFGHDRMVTFFNAEFSCRSDLHRVRSVSFCCNVIWCDVEEVSKRIRNCKQESGFGEEIEVKGEIVVVIGGRGWVGFAGL